MRGRAEGGGARRCARPGCPPRGERPEALDRDLRRRPGPGGRVVVRLVDVDAPSPASGRAARSAGSASSAASSSRSDLRSARTRTPVAAGRPATSVGHPAGQPGPVRRGQRLAEAARHRQHHVEPSSVSEAAQHPPDERRVQERQVGRADEGHVGTGPSSAASPTAMPCIGPTPLDRVVDDLDAGRQLRQLLPGRARRRATGPSTGARRARRRCGAAASTRATPGRPSARPIREDRPPASTTAAPRSAAPDLVPSTRRS